MTTLPGNLTSPTAGPLLRRGAPGRYTANGGGVTVLGLEPTHAHVFDGAADRRVYVPLSGLSLDLSDDPAGMDIAARWLARHHGLTVGATAPGWRRVQLAPDRWVWLLGGPGSRMSFHIAESDPAEALALACLAAVPR